MDIAQYSTENSMDIVILPTAMGIPQLSRIQGILFNIIHRIFDGFCTVRQTD
jgi:hypothetical protein